MFHFTKLDQYLPVHSFLKPWNLNELRIKNDSFSTIINYSEIGLYRCPFKFGLEVKFRLEWNNSIIL